VVWISPDKVDTKNVLMKQTKNIRRHTMDEKKYLTYPKGAPMVKSTSLSFCENLYVTYGNCVVAPLPKHAAYRFTGYGI
jgi:hypothetical protein